ncbi:Acetyl xylan esterase [Beutenbergia cavernae DSM 12333]|uniref:Acetyl xylan esterase n=1 Tax=Beutenbergia cavernae (strain ATCC BAA-8 / DSM 12333 / CCUG 43141 / JCM 11478 / NBRC 16432 / NCIMB 13614 / HKI 0122) TaxID=471853 RepID=C5C0D3_BEUC1|nr:acetylxylan esterase [Beutenbergia cavernae]ACQ79319.1 Acetyl xylan esterase [Beutenbergia cavernae DSM 12333]
MPFFDIAADALPDYRPALAIPDDLDAFWAATLAETREHDLDVRVEPVDAGLELVEAFDVTFAGFGGHPVKAWYLRPRGATALPAVVQYVGYGGGRGLPHEHLAWPSAGYAFLVMDTRGQGARWGTGGDTPDPAGTGSSVPGFMTRGIDDPADHYYRRVFTDGVRAVEAVRTLDGVDPARVAVTGGSQGGGISLAVAGLVPDLVAVMPDVPFLCHMRRAITITAAHPYGEVVAYLAVHRGREEQVLRTLSYVDAAHLATRASAPALFSVGLMDTICPPSTVYAAFNAYGHPAGSRIDVYRYNEHEGGGGFRWPEQRAWLAALLG